MQPNLRRDGEEHQPFRGVCIGGIGCYFSRRFHQPVPLGLSQVSQQAGIFETGFDFLEKAGQELVHGHCRGAFQEVEIQALIDSLLDFRLITGRHGQASRAGTRGGTPPAAHSLIAAKVSSNQERRVSDGRGSSGLRRLAGHAVPGWAAMADTRKGRDSATFEYDKSWLAHSGGGGDLLQGAVVFVEAAGLEGGIGEAAVSVRNLFTAVSVCCHTSGSFFVA